MTDKGWITLHRKIEDNWIWNDKPFSKGQAWIDLILMANHQDKKFLLGNELVEVKRGSKITSLRKLSERWEWSVKKVTNFLELLESDGMIEVKRNTKRTAYTIVNYNDYQDKDNEKRNTKETQKKHAGNTRETRKKTNNNDNNDNNDKQDIRSTQFDYIISEWNSLDKNISNIQSINQGTTRYKLLKARENEYGKDKIIEAIRRIDNSSFLKGYEKSWKITFDWFIKPNNFIKVLEGNYADEKKKKFNTNNNIQQHEDLEQKRQEEIIKQRMNRKIPIKYRK